MLENSCSSINSIIFTFSWGLLSCPGRSVSLIWIKKKSYLFLYFFSIFRAYLVAFLRPSSSVA